MFFPEYQKTASISRLVESGGKRVWTDISESVQLFIQPAGTEDSLLFGGDISTSFKAYSKERSAIQQTDRLVIDGDIYEIRSIQNFWFGTVPHSKIFLEKAK